jgi:hypothetical protein
MLMTVKWQLALVMAVVLLVGFIGGMNAIHRATVRGDRAGAIGIGEPPLTRTRSEDRPPAGPTAAPVAVPVKPDVAPGQVIVPPEEPPQSKPGKASGQTSSPPAKVVATANQGGLPAKEPWQDPVARLALAFVGMDEEAEAYWYEAINDPNLPPNERQDLIEDLNEDGLSDPKHPTADDLPLIVNRMLIIEAVAWDAMDEVNAAAFQEAYKDLVNLGRLVFGNGEPVQ